MRKYTDKEITDFLIIAEKRLNDKSYTYGKIIPDYCDVVVISRQLQAENEKHRWIPVAERLPEYFKGTKISPRIYIIDGGKIVIGEYHWGRFQYWHGAFCNTDTKSHQSNITHWKPMILPEEKESEK